MVTLCCASGDVGEIYQDIIAFNVTKTNIHQLIKPETKIMINLGNPSMALKYSFLPVTGVGLARIEFIISEHIKVHPLALIHPEKVLDQHSIDIIKKLTKNYVVPKDYFVHKLAEGIGMSRINN
jgi:pyruvate,water dikinase